MTPITFNTSPPKASKSDHSPVFFLFPIFTLSR